MDRIRYGISGGLDERQIKKMYEAAITLIEKVGLKVEHEGVLKILAGHQDITIKKGERVHFKGQLVEKLIKDLHYPDNVNMPDYTIAAGSYALNILDMDSRKVRKPTMEDLIQMTKLADSMDMAGTSPVRPLDLGSDELSEIAMVKAAYEHSRFLNTGVFDQVPKSSLRVAEYIYEMSQAAGKEMAIDCWIISPFKTPTDQLEILYHFIDRKVSMFINTMPVMGTTSPISIICSYIQSMAELFGGLTLLKLINPKGRIHTGIFDSIRSYPFDMKYGTFVYGSPEDIWATMLQVQLNRYCNFPIMAKSLLTTAAQPDAQAAAEKMGHTMMSALSGVKLFTSGGLLSVDELYSAEQAVIDFEIVNYVRRTVEGFDFGNLETGMEAIVEVVNKDGTFLDHETTLSNFRNAFWEPELFEHQMLNTWLMKGERPVLDRAKELAKQRIKAHEFHLPSDRSAELDKIYNHARKKILRLS